MASTAAWTTPSSAPRQPAWAEATIRASGSTISTGAQSADRAPQTTPGVLVTTASPSGRTSPHEPSAVMAMVEWIWKQVLRSSGATPNQRAARARFSITSAGSSLLPRPTFRLS